MRMYFEGDPRPMVRRKLLPVYSWNVPKPRNASIRNGSILFSLNNLLLPQNLDIVRAEIQELS